MVGCIYKVVIDDIIAKSVKGATSSEDSAMRALELCTGNLKTASQLIAETSRTAYEVAIASKTDFDATTAENYYGARTKAVFDAVIADAAKDAASPEDAARRARELYTEQAVGSRARVVLHNSKSSAT